MKYGEVKEFYNDPFHITEDTIIDYLRDIFEFHFENTPYWHAVRKDKKINLELIFDGSLEEVIEKIFNFHLFIDDNELRENWLSFLPKNYKGRLRFYQSSGTTGPRSLCHWDYEYVKLLVFYLREALDKLYHLDEIYNEAHQMIALLHGPYGWYQEEMSELIWSYGGILYFIGTETEGIKKALEREGIQGALKLLEPLVKYTQRVLKKDKINTARTALQLLDLFKPFKENLETIMLSGTSTTPEVLEQYQKQFENSTFIPLYGHSAFGDAIGVYNGKDIRYYPNYPFTLILPLVPENGKYRMAEYGERGLTGIIIARPEILIVKLENETIKRVRPIKPFKWDGFANPRRRE
ncbi:hypothetical protein E3E31_11245 [Thermococcus sp. M39]|uniref:hypothetical protein n=1 Tax=unclassified Thermococcus TaxID=2627626 RepID=UPI00143CB07C|nr:MULTISPECIES: hypothetical protein [unclassified Thermococcus]NJE09088.1 hypothetical protein [Thermococcus sp. M39]NJE12037.1 hypothetical protein [Thermococcus sp. LS2]